MTAAFALSRNFCMTSIYDRLPEAAYFQNDDPKDGAPPVLCVQRGQIGFFPIFSAKSADALNAAAGVSSEDADLMRQAATYGWESCFGQSVFQDESSEGDGSDN